MTVGAQKLSDLRCEASDTAHTNRSLSSAKERIFQNHKKHKITLSPLVILLRCALSRSPTPSPIGRCPHRQDDGPLPLLPPTALARPVATRKTTRLSRQSPLLFVRNAPPFAAPHTRGRHDTRPRIRASVEVHFLPSPFTFTPTLLTYKPLRVNFTPVFCFTEVKAKGVKPSHLSPYCPTIYAQWVKR